MMKKYVLLGSMFALVIFPNIYAQEGTHNLMIHNENCSYQGVVNTGETRFHYGKVPGIALQPETCSDGWVTIGVGKTAVVDVIAYKKDNIYRACTYKVEPEGTISHSGGFPVGPNGHTFNCTLN